MTLKNTDNSYRIIVRNTQTYDGETGVIEEIAYGTYSEKNNKRYVIYRTAEDDAGEASIIIIEDGCVTVKRRGTVNSSMVYREGRKHAFPYETQFGSIDMEIETHRIISDMRNDGGRVMLEYTLTAGGEPYGNTTEIIIARCDA